MKVKHFLFLFFIMFLGGRGEKIAFGASENFGLGPLEIRDQFPVTFPFLSLTPENTKTTEAGKLFFSYQVALANTFLNSAGTDEQITKDEVSRGLVEADFYSSKTGRPLTGFQTYVDVESYRHLFRLKYGMSDSLEIGLDFPYVSFVGGSFDFGAEAVHTLVGIDNNSAEGAYRTFSEQNRYDFYILKEDEFLINTDQQFENLASEPLIKLKWNISEGSSIFPALTVKFVYKLGSSERNSEEKLIRSGSADTGSALILSKGYGDWVVYLGWGESKLGESGEFAGNITQRYMALEYQLDQDTSFVFQTVNHTSIFPPSGNIQGTSKEIQSAYLSNSTEVAVIGYKEWIGDFLFETGFVEDYNQTGNQTDFVLFMELGVQW